MDEMAVNILDWVFLGNLVRAWLVAVLLGLSVYALLVLVRTVLTRNIARFAKRTETLWDDILLRALSATRQWLLIALAVWAAATSLAMPDSTRRFVAGLTILAIIVQIGVWGTAAIKGYVEAYGKRNLESDAGSVMTVRALGFLASVGLWTVVFLVVLENLGIDVTALIAGLGVGGIAVALATQNVLGDLFGSLSIVLDKPFVVGDFVVVGEMAGSVERVGLKTTRIRSLSGEQLVFANTDLLQSRIRNYKRMFERRIVFAFGVEYGTTREQLEWIAALVPEIIESLPDARFDRAHFQKFGDSSLDFEVVYYVKRPEYNAYMDIQQTINLELLERLTARGISFAFPTRTIHVVGEPAAS